MRNYQRQASLRRAAVATELLIAALCVLILYIAASPFYRAAQDEAARLRCRTARRLIGSAQEEFRARSPEHVYARTMRELSDLLPAIPKCPRHGRYRFRTATHQDRYPGGRPIGSGHLIIKCSYEGHESYIVPQRSSETETP
jgi:type II secretory pathway pseudopilin PulG